MRNMKRVVNVTHEIESKCMQCSDVEREGR
jgi:hypothetical protein